ncbi:MAG: hypothetical protein H7274_19825 [Rhodoferax sp.]|nr:hypothetical protein [Rhodoferax sp.]
MSRQSGLFDDDVSPDAAVPLPAARVGAAVALTALKFSDSTLSAEQRRFNQLLERTELLAGRIEAARVLADAHRIVWSAALRPLESQRNLLMRDMALWLDDRLKRPGLTRKQQQMASDIICELAGSLVLEGVENMRELHDAHSDETLGEQEKASAAETQAFLEEMLGEALNSDQEFANPQDVLHASMEQIRQQAEAHQQARAAHKAKRARTAQKQQTEDADGALRTIYRQLASALHPDRETDPAEQVRKTALMSEANAAYARRDLLALLQLQLRADLADVRKVSTMAKEKIAALTALLKERVDVLARELRDFENHSRAEFDLPPHLPLNAAGLRRHMQEQKHSLLADIGMMQRDFVRVRDDAEFKRWLRDQQRLAQEEERFERMHR